MFVSLEELKTLAEDLQLFIKDCEESDASEVTLHLSSVSLCINVNKCSEAPSPTSDLEQAMEEAYVQRCFDTAKLELEQVFSKTTQAMAWTDNCDSQFSDFYSYKNRLMTSALHSRSSSVILEPEPSEDANDFLATEMTRLAQLKHKLERNYLNSEKLLQDLTSEKSKVALEKKLLQDLKSELIEAMAFRE